MYSVFIVTLTTTLVVEYLWRFVASFKQHVRLMALFCETNASTFCIIIELCHGDMLDIVFYDNLNIIKAIKCYSICLVNTINMQVY